MNGIYFDWRSIFIELAIQQRSPAISDRIFEWVTTSVEVEQILLTERSTALFHVVVVIPEVLGDFGDRQVGIFVSEEPEDPELGSIHSTVLLELAGVEISSEVGLSVLIYRVEPPRGSVDQSVGLELTAPSRDIIVIFSKGVSDDLGSSSPFRFQKFENLIVETGHPPCPLTHSFAKIKLSLLNRGESLVNEVLNIVLNRLKLYFTKLSLDLCVCAVQSIEDDCHGNRKDPKIGSEIGPMGTDPVRSLVKATTMRNLNQTPVNDCGFQNRATTTACGPRRLPG